MESFLRGRRDDGAKLLVVYITGGYEGWEAAVETAAAAGADAIEIGIPFSDPVMDGPVIQEASQAALEAGAEDVVAEGEVWRVTTDPSDTNSVREALEGSGIEVSSTDLTYLPQNVVELSSSGEAAQVLAVMDALDDHDDVQGVYANFDVSDEVLAELAKG